VPVPSTSLSRRRLLQVTAAIPAAAVLPALAQGPKPTTVTVSHFPIAGIASIYVGEQQGFFKAEGITLQRETVKLPADAVANLIGGRLQVGFINVGGLSQAAIQGLPLKVLSSMYFSEGKDTGLYVRGDSPIKRLADMKGKSLALVQLRNNVHAAVLASLDAAGVDPDSVKISLIPVTNTAAALRSGTVDAAQVVEPFATMAGDEIRSILDNPFAVIEKRTCIAHMITTQQFARENPEVAAAFTRAMNKSNEFAGQNPAAVRKAVSSFTEIPAAVLAKMHLPVFSPEIGTESVNRQVDTMVKYKILASRPDLSRYFG